MCQVQSICFIHIDECKNDWFSQCLYVALRIEPQSSSFLVMRKGHSFPLKEYLSLQYIKSDLVHFIIPIFCLSNWGNLCEKPFLLEVWHWCDIYHFKIICIIHSECFSWSLLKLMRYTNFSKPLKITLNSWHSW